MRRHRADGNQAEIVKAFEEFGATVRITSQVGNDFPDLVVGWRSRNLLIEVKSKDEDLSDGQRDFQRWWRGGVFTIWDVEDVRRLMVTLGF